MSKFISLLVVSILTAVWTAPAEGGVFPKHLHFPNTAVVHKQFNFHVVAPGVWRSSATNKRSLKRMKKRGLKTIINLRRNKSYHKKERKISKELGIQYYHIPLNPKHRQDSATLRRILEISSNPANQPVLIHCRSGKDRTGLISALYKIQYLDANVEEVYEEMLLYGYNAKKYPHLGRILHAWPDAPHVNTYRRTAKQATSGNVPDVSVRTYSSWLKPFTFRKSKVKTIHADGHEYEAKVYSSILGTD